MTQTNMAFTLDKRNVPVLDYVSTPMTLSEASMFDLIDTIRYGSIHDVELVDTQMATTRNMSSRRLCLLKFMREESPKIDEMVVHDGEVAYINVIGHMPFRHVRKTKF